jgi:hypothetical protein
VIRNKINIPVNHGRITWLKIKKSLYSGLIIVTDPDESRNKGVTIRPIIISITTEMAVNIISSVSNI